MSEALYVLGRVLLVYLVLFLPVLATMLAALTKGLCDKTLTALLGLVSLGLFGYAVFWTWFLWPRVGRLVALAVPIISLVFTLGALRRLDAIGRRLLRMLAVPLLLIAAYSTFVLAFGYSYGGVDKPFKTAERRFSHPLPMDNAIPYILGEGVWGHNIAKPLFAGWHSSDRPPLQTGLILGPYRWLPHDREFTAQIVGVLAQSTWILALWAFLAALEIESGLIVLILVACMTSGFVLVNTFFTWPKLLAGAFSLGAITLMFTSARKTSAAMLAGVLWALALLSHGGAAFAFIGALICLPFFRPRMRFRDFAVLGISAFLLYLPWILYQHFFDPPGNRLLYMHLAGVDNIDPRPFGQALLDSYSHYSFREIVWQKWMNWIAAGDQVLRYWRGFFRFDPPELRECQFFFLPPTLGFVFLGLPLLLLGFSKRFRTRYWRIAAWIALSCFITLVAWCLILMGPFRAVLHQGAYAVPLLAFTGCCLSLWSVSRRLAWIMVVAQASLDVALYLFTMPHAGSAHVAMAFLAIAAILLVILLLYCIAAADSGVERDVNTAH